MPTHRTFLTGDHLRRTATRLPGRTALVFGAERVDYAALDQQADAVAASLARAGLGKGDRIAILSPTVLDFPGLFFGVARSGCVTAMLSARLTANDVAQVIEKAGLRLIFCGPGQRDKAVEARAAAGRALRLVAVGEEAAPDELEAADFRSLAAFTEGADALPPSPAAEDPYLMVLSGGTTGTPKLIVHSHFSTTLWSIGAAHGFGLDGDDIVAVSTPLFYAAGLFTWLMPAIMLGATSVLVPAWDPAAFTDLVEANGVTAALLVPTQLNDLIRQPDFDPARLASLRKINHAGMPMPVALLERLCTLLPDAGFTDNYGSSECGPMTARRHHHLPAKAHSVGRPLITVDLAVAGPDGAHLPQGEAGEIVTRGGQTLIEYFEDPEATVALRRGEGGWIATGDVGYFDEDGFLVLVDRARDVIIAGGENIFPTEIENALYAHPAVAEAAAFGIPDERWGELPAAHVVLKPGEAVVEAALVDFVAERIPRHKRPRMIKFVDALPKTAVGKIQRGAIRHEYWKDRDREI